MYESIRNLAVLAICSVFFLYGCLAEPTEVIPKRVSIKFNVEGVGGENAELTGGGDTLIVSQFKLYLNSFIIETQGDARLQSNEGIVLRYREQDAGTDVNSFAAPIGYSDFSTFTAVEYFVEPPPDSVSIGDPHLVQSGERYSLFVTGTYNGSEFNFLSKADLNQTEGFGGGVTIGADAETLQMIFQTEIPDIFVDAQSGRILSPEVSADSALIISNLGQSLRVKATAERFLPN